jgi:hypothetical protein
MILNIASLFAGAADAYDLALSNNDLAFSIGNAYVTLIE